MPIFVSPLTGGEIIDRIHYLLFIRLSPLLKGGLKKEVHDLCQMEIFIPAEGSAPAAA